MRVLFSYSESQIEVNSVSLKICSIDSQTKVDTIPLRLENGAWVGNTDIPSGKYVYKFIVNNELPLCDFKNNLFEWGPDKTLWSYLCIDEKGILLGTEKRHVKVSYYSLSANAPQPSKYSPQDRISVSLSCENVVGVHILTLAWYTPSGSLYEFSESAFCSDPHDMRKPISTLFWVNYHPDMRKHPREPWSIKLFLDGQLLLTDKFSIAAMLSNIRENNKKESFYA